MFKAPEGLDLSVVLAPDPYPLPAMDAEVWQRLPYLDHKLISAAQAAYGANHVLPLPGAEAGIGAVARLFQTWYGSMRVVLAEPAFEVWGERLRRASHVVLDWPVDQVAQGEIPDCDVVVIGRPVNPTGQVISDDVLLDLAKRCRENGGWLVVDEAFIDGESIRSFSHCAEQAPAIVLRSISPFFGLGGARVGFICAPEPVIKALNSEVGPWAVSGPALWAAGVALADLDWQNTQRERLSAYSDRMADLWRSTGLDVHITRLFVGLSGPKVKPVYQGLLKHGVRTRLFKLEQPMLRCSLPHGDQQWQQLEAALAEITYEVSSTR